MASAHDFTFTGIDNKPIDMKQYKGHPVLVVNVASFCGFTPQYKELQQLHETYGPKGLVVLGVPSKDFGDHEPKTEPEIAKPICMAWDHRGRLWIAESFDYPNVKRSRDAVGRDRIKICEDRDGDGRYESATVFLEGVPFPTGVMAWPSLPDWSSSVTPGVRIGVSLVPVIVTVKVAVEVPPSPSETV